MVKRRTPISSSCALRAPATLLALVALLCPLLLLAPPARGEDLVGVLVGDVVVEGAADEGSAASVRELFGLRAGDTLTPDAVRLGIKRVLLTGPYADVRVEAVAQGDRARVFVVLVPDVVLKSVDIEAPGLPRDRLRDVIGLDVGDRYRAERVEAAARALRGSLSDLGYPRAAVQVDVVEVGATERAVTFVVDKGVPVRVRFVRIAGDARAAPGDVTADLGVATGEPFDRARLDEGLARVRDALRAKRHLDARAEVDRVQFNEDRTAADVLVTVDAGARYHVRFVGNGVMPSATLKGVVDVDELDGVDAGALARASTTLTEWYRRAGYAQASVAAYDVPAQPPLDQSAEREVRFVVREGVRAEIDAIVVEGATARPAKELVDEAWRTAEAATTDIGLLQRVDRGDIDDLLSVRSGKEPAARPYETSDEGIEIFPRPFIGKRPVYLEPVFVEARERVADLYRADGYLDVRVEGPQAVYSPDGRRVTVRYVVTEGPRITVAAVRFDETGRCAGRTFGAQAPAIADDDGCGGAELALADIIGDLPLQPGDPVSFEAVADARVVVERNLQQRGFPFARVTESVERLSTEAAVDIVYALDTGPRVVIREVRVQGNDLTQEAIIRERVTLKPGDVYDIAEIEASQQRLARLGLFSSVSLDLLDDAPTATVRDLLVLVRERPQFAVELGAGASVEDGPRAFLAGEMRNIFGFGIGIRGRTQVNYPRAFYDFLYEPDDPNNPLTRFPAEDNVFVEWGRFFEVQGALTAELPKVYGMPFDTRLHVDTVALREIRPAFTLNRASILFGTDLQPARWLHVGPQIEAELSDFDCPNDLDFGQSCGEGSIGLTRRLDAGFIRQTTFRMSSSVDLRDNPLRPRAGVIMAGAADLALGSGTLRVASATDEPVEVSSDFVKLTGQATGYVPLAPRFVLAVSGRAGNIIPFTGAYIPLYKRFYLGGTQSIRGYREDEILPADNARWPASQPLPDGDVDSVLESKNSLGGNFFANVRTELRIGLVGDLELGTFVDAGQLLEDPLAFDIGGVAAGAGIGLRYNTPVGPFVIDVGWKVLDGRRRLPVIHSLERLNLHLSIGSF